MEREIEIVPVSRAMLPQVTEVFVEAFRSEGFTRTWMGIFGERQRARYVEMCRRMFEVHVRSGMPIYAAVEDGHVVGMMALRAPDSRTSPWALGSALPSLIRTAAAAIPYLLRHRRAARRLAQAAKPPRTLPRQYWFLEVIGVVPGHQGKGIGSKLLRYARERAFSAPDTSGIYLYTGDERNVRIYEKAGYELVDAREAEGLTAYHMFLPRSEEFRPRKGEGAQRWEAKSA